MTIDKLTIQTTLCNFIKENLVADGVEVTPGTPLEQLGLDSFAIIEIILFIERKFSLELPDGELTKQNVFSVESFSDCVYKHLTVN